jgi:hypothetical protein
VIGSEDAFPLPPDLLHHGHSYWHIWPKTASDTRLAKRKLYYQVSTKDSLLMDICLLTILLNKIAHEHTLTQSQRTNDLNRLAVWQNITFMLDKAHRRT